jgi:fumarate reductase iron-sulfur subunit
MNYAPGPVRVGPLAHFPIVKDLVVDLEDFLTKLQKVKPWIVRKDDFKPEREFIQSPAQLNKFKQFSLCINCTLCYAACPVYGLDPNFLGPAAIALAHRYNLDSRDQAAEDRHDIVSQHEGIWDCTVVGECTTVCPKHVDPSLAIQQYKLTATAEWFKSFLMPRGNK